MSIVDLISPTYTTPMGMTLHHCSSPISTTHSPNLPPSSPLPPASPIFTTPLIPYLPPPPFSMARRKLATKTSTCSIASHNPDMVSALSSHPLSPMSSPPESQTPSAFSGEKRPSHEAGRYDGEDEEEEEEDVVKRVMSTSEKASSPLSPSPPQQLTDNGNCGRERLQRHRSQVAGSVWIPDVWGKEEFLKDWTDCVAFDRSLVPSGIVSAKSALIDEYRRSAAGAEGVRINLRAN